MHSPIRTQKTTFVSADLILNIVAVYNEIRKDPSSSPISEDQYQIIWREMIDYIGMIPADVTSALLHRCAKKPLQYLRVALKNEALSNRSPQKNGQLVPQNVHSPSKSLQIPNGSPTKFSHNPISEKKTTSSQATDQSLIKITKIIKGNITTETVNLEYSNRVIRMVGNPDQFLVVKFSKTLLGDRDNSLSVVQEVLSTGMQYKEKLYKLLAFSSSGLREGQVYFFAEECGWTVEKVRSRLGIFSEALSQGISKYCARLGQCFSNSIPTMDFSLTGIMDIPDIKRNNFNFSDGCGIINEAIVPKICQHLQNLELLPPNYLPSVFQIRIGGYKGVVASYPFSDPATMLKLRPSMKKFESAHTNLEILNWSHPNQSAYLNKQFINVLYSRGVPIEAFQNIILKYFESLHDVTTNCHAALSAIMRTEGEDRFTRLCTTMLLAGHPIDDPHLQAMLISWRNNRAKLVSESLRLPLDNSRCLIGVIDETGFLEEGEVYINLSNMKGALHLDVMVTRSPCMHPGDVRVLKARSDCPLPLAALKDCIVFSQKGSRPVTDMMAGGDLDGDMYLVCWESSLFPNIEEPADYKTTSTTNKKEQTPLPNNIKDEDLTQLMAAFFIKYHKSGQPIIGRLGKLHESICESSPLGARDPKAKEIACLFSQAVDCGKSGVFPEKPNHDSYPSRPGQGVISKLIDFTKKLVSQFHVPVKTVVKIDNDLLYIVDQNTWDYYYKEATELLLKFNNELKTVIDERKLIEEETNQNERKQTKSVKSLKKSAEDQLYDRYYRIFYSGTRDDEDRKQKASAWYFAAYSANKTAFGWIPYPYLNIIKSSKVDSNKPPVVISPSAWQYLKPKWYKPSAPSQ